MIFILRVLKSGVTLALGNVESSLPQQVGGTELYNKSQLPNICTSLERGTQVKICKKNELLSKSSFFVSLVVNVLSNRFILTSKGIYVKSNYQGRLQL